MQAEHTLGNSLLDPSTQEASAQSPHRARWQALTACMMLGMTASWVSAAYVMAAGVQAAAGFVIAGALFFAVGLSAFGVERLVEALRLNASAERFLFLGTLAVWIYLHAGILLYPGSLAAPGGLALRFLRNFADLTFLLRPAFYLTLAVILLWMQGITLARHWAGPRRVQREFQRGLLLLLGIGLAGASLGRALPTGEMLTFLLAGLLAMGAARLSAQSRVRGGRALPLSRTWGGSVVIAAGALVSVSLALAVLVGAPLSALIGAIFALIAAWLVGVVGILLQPLLMLIFRGLAWIWSRISPMLEEAPEFPQTLLDPTVLRGGVQSLISDVEPVPWGQTLASALNALLIALALAALALGVGLALRRRRVWQSSPNPLAGEMRETQTGFRAFLRSLWQGVTGATGGGTRLSPAARALAAARVRRIYAQLLQRSTRLGVPREPSLTPLEFLPQLRELFPAGEAELRTITRAYLKVRYGAYPETRKEIQAVAEAWRRIRRMDARSAR